jgi:hypothetical protein
MVDIDDFSHPFLGIYDHNKKYYRVLLKDDNCKKWKSILDDTMETIYHESTLYYLLNKKEYKEFLDLVKSVDKKDAKTQQRNDKTDEKDENKEEDEDSSDESSESSDTDDELIQKTLSRRLTSESKGYEVDDDHVSDSEMEDVISLSRRFRAVYKVVKNLAKRIEKIESNLKI